MKLREFTKQRANPKTKGSKYRTINLDQDLHQFLKRTAGHYEIPIADLLYNIISTWKNEFESEINDDIINKLGKD